MGAKVTGIFPTNNHRIRIKVCTRTLYIERKPDWLDRFVFYSVVYMRSDGAFLHSFQDDYNMRFTDVRVIRGIDNLHTFLNEQYSHNGTIIPKDAIDHFESQILMSEICKKRKCF